MNSLRRQFQDQQERVIGFALYREPSLDQTLAMMADVDQRGESTEQLARYLGRLHARVVAELQSLQLTRNVEDARAELAGLEVRRARLEDSTASEVAEEGLSLAEIDAEMRRLQAVIADASARALQTLSARRG